MEKVLHLQLLFHIKSTDKEPAKLPEEKFGNDKFNKKLKKVLLVEDNDLNREIALEIIRDIGLDVEYATDGHEAVRIFKSSEENYFNLILMDIQMPRMNGYDATRAIRALPRKDARIIPIFAMTANTLDSDKMRAYESGMDKVIEKPIDITVFTKLLDSL